MDSVDSPDEDINMNEQKAINALPPLPNGELDLDAYIPFVKSTVKAFFPSSKCLPTILADLRLATYTIKDNDAYKAAMRTIDFNINSRLSELRDEGGIGYYTIPAEHIMPESHSSSDKSMPDLPLEEVVERWPEESKTIRSNKSSNSFEDEVDISLSYEYPSIHTISYRPTDRLPITREHVPLAKSYASSLGKKSKSIAGKSVSNYSEGACGKRHVELGDRVALTRHVADQLNYSLKANQFPNSHILPVYTQEEIDGLHKPFPQYLQSHQMKQNFQYARDNS